jgi:hypothetical protein
MKPLIWYISRTHSVKNHDFAPKNHIFSILGGAREISGVFHVKNHDFTPKKSYFFQFPDTLNIIGMLVHFFYFTDILEEKTHIYI